jgi:hypothetical protein
MVVGSGVVVSRRSHLLNLRLIFCFGDDPSTVSGRFNRHPRPDGGAPKLTPLAQRGRAGYSSTRSPL